MFTRTLQNTIQEKDGVITAFEFKWKDKKTKFPQKFLDAYGANGFVIDRDNFREFVKI